MKDFLPGMGEQKVLDRLDQIQDKTMTYPVLIGIGFGKIVEQFVWYPDVNTVAVVRWTAFMVAIIMLYLLSDESKKKKEQKKKTEIEGKGKVN